MTGRPPVSFGAFCPEIAQNTQFFVALIILNRMPSSISAMERLLKSANAILNATSDVADTQPMILSGRSLHLPAPPLEELLPNHLRNGPARQLLGQHLQERRAATTVSYQQTLSQMLSSGHAGGMSDAVQEEMVCRIFEEQWHIQIRDLRENLYARAHQMLSTAATFSNVSGLKCVGADSPGERLSARDGISALSQFDRP